MKGAYGYTALHESCVCGGGEGRVPAVKGAYGYTALHESCVCGGGEGRVPAVKGAYGYTRCTSAVYAVPGCTRGRRR